MMMMMKHHVRTRPRKLWSPETSSRGFGPIPASVLTGWATSSQNGRPDRLFYCRDGRRFRRQRWYGEHGGIATKMLPYVHRVGHVVGHQRDWGMPVTVSWTVDRVGAHIGTEQRRRKRAYR